MLDTQPSTLSTESALELLGLEEAFSEECKCQSKHSLEECSIEVVGIKKVCHTEFLICQNSWNWNTERISNPIAVCAKCKRLCSECWTIRPV